MTCSVRIIDIEQEISRDVLMNSFFERHLWISRDHKYTDKDVFHQDYVDYINASWKAHKTMDNEVYVVCYNQDGSFEADLLRLMTPGRLDNREYRMTDVNDEEIQMALANKGGIMKVLSKSKTASRLFRTLRVAF